MDFEHDIMVTLREVGSKGMPLRRIALNVYNMRNSLFEPLDKEVVYAKVGQYLRRVSQLSGSAIEKADTKGWYRLNMKSQQVQQLLLEFEVAEQDEWMM